MMRSLRRDWNDFWYAPRSGAALGLFRLVFGALVVAYALLLFPERYLWFSQGGMLTRAAADTYNAMGAGGPRINVFDWGVGDRQLTMFFLVFLLAALGLTLGLWTRLSALIVVVCLNSLHNRDNVIHNSGDVVMMVMALYLVLAPAGAACSLDRLWRVLKGVEGDEPPRIIPWAQRLMQLQVSTIYITTAMSKLGGSNWTNGTAAYFPIHLPESARFPLPLMDGNHVWAINLLTYFTLLTEITLGTLVWVPRLRLYVLGMGVMLHLGIEYSLNIPLFSFLMIASYLVFLNERHLKDFLAWMRQPLAVARLRVVYDGECDFCKSALLVVRYLDVFRLLAFLDYHDPEQLAQTPVRYADADNAAVAVDRRGRQYPGFDAFRAMAWRLPATWLLAPFLYIPGVPQLGRRIYAWIAANRPRMPVAPRFKGSAPEPAQERVGA